MRLVAGRITFCNGDESQVRLETVCLVEEGNPSYQEWTANWIVQAPFVSLTETASISQIIAGQCV
jgi:hypothetical protein